MDPFRLVHGLGPDYRPLGRPSAEPVLPRFPSRLRSMIFGFALVAEAEQRAIAGANQGG